MRNPLAPLRGRPALAGLVALAVLLALAAFLPPHILSRLNFLWIAVISAAGLNLLVGLAGQVSLGQAGFMAIGGYTGALVHRYVGLDMVTSLVLGASFSALVGFLIGLPSLRLRGFYLALTTLALHFACVFAANQVQKLAGPSATTGFGIDRAMIGPWRLAGDLPWFVALSVIGVLTLVGFANLARSKVGRAWTAIRDRDIAAAIIGVNVTRYKLLAFVVSSGIAGMAGVLQAYYLGNVAVESFSIDLAIAYVAMIVVGGMGTVAGTILGAIIVLQLPFLIQLVRAATVGSDASNSFIVFDLQAGAFGLVIIAFLLFEPDGMIGIVNRLRGLASGRGRAARPAPPGASPSGASPRLAEPSSGAAAQLVLEDVAVVYARAARAIDGISFVVPKGGIVALLGPNGAGKTTTLRAVAGFLPGDRAVVERGRILFEGRDIGRLSPDRVAKLGIAMVAEREKIFPSLTVAENLRIGGLANTHPQEGARLAALVDDLFPILKQRRDQQAGYLSGGERQMLSIATALLSNPRILLVDELSLGLAPKVVGELIEVLRRLNRERGLTIVLVEQSATVAFALAETVHLLSNGRTTLSGTPDELRRRPEVREHYLGITPKLGTTPATETGHGRVRSAS